MNKEIKVKTKGGYLWATDSGDIDYPGIDIEFVANNEGENALSRPRILFEYPTDGKLRILVWDDKDNEDYTREIVFDIQEENVMTREQIIMNALKIEKEDVKKTVEHLIKQDCIGGNFMEHYVVINDWSSDYECGVTILGIAHTLEEAKEIFNNCVGDEKKHAEEHGYEIYTDDETDFDAGEDGYYAREHTRVYIQKA